METIDIQSKSFVIRWLKVRPNDLVTYQLKPLNKPIEFGIYKKLKDEQTQNLTSKGLSSQIHFSDDTKELMEFTAKSLHRNSYFLNSDDDVLSTATINNDNSRRFTTSNISNKNQDNSLHGKLLQSGFKKVYNPGCVPNNKLLQGQLEISDDTYYYAFILDNTFSKTSKRKVLFHAYINHYQDSDCAISFDESPISNYSIRGRSNSSVPYHMSQNSSNSSTTPDLFRVKQGRILQGYLLKKGRRRLQGFSKRLFKLDFKYGTLSYYLNERNTTCRGEVVIGLSTVSANKKARLIIIDSGMEIWVLKGRDDQEWKEWVDSLEFCYQNQRKEHEQSEKDSISANANASTLLANLQLICQKLEVCKLESLQYSLQQTDFISRPQTYQQYIQPQHSFISRSSSMSSLINSFHKLKSDSNPDLSIPKLVSSNEHDLYKKLYELESMVRSLAKQSRNLINCTIDMKTPAASIKSIDEYFDAIDDENAVIMLNDEEIDDRTNEESFESNTPSIDINKDSNMDYINHKDSLYKNETNMVSSDLYPLPWNSVIKRRNDVKNSIADPPSLLSFLRKNVGKDLSSISMPITSNEPVTILQMMSETFEYCELLNKASLDSPLKQLSYIAAFAISYLSIQRQKTRSLRKPFNPLLGETFELVREDKGIRLISEKVNHKPQVFAFYVEHELWELNYTVSPIQKFWGKSIEFINEGTLKLVFKKTGDTYEWSQPTTILKNIIAGERYIEPTNEFEVISSLGTKAVITFKSGGMFSGRSEDLIITLHENGKLCETLKGQWTKGLINSRTDEKIWEVGELVPNSERKYGFTKFAANLNEITELELNNLPPTDSRLRPDLRLYENGEIEKAEIMKLKLEQDQRNRRNEGKHTDSNYFIKSTSNSEWIFIKGHNSYWERRKRQDWNNIPQLW